MTQKTISKRQWRDGVSAKPKNSRRPSENTTAKAKRPSEKPASGRAAVQRPSENKTSNRFENRTEAPKQHAAKAKKLVVRNPNRKIMERARDLKERRSDLSRMEPERLQKVLAASGVGSRREMEDWINNGWVTVNGKTAQLGDSIFDRLPQAASSRWVAIGRLDINTSGLLILTTSGELVQRFAHPRFEVEREYAVRTLGGLTTEQMRMLTEEGIMLEDGLAKVERIREQGGEGVNKWYNVVIKEGRNREVRRIFEYFDLTVSRLVRIGFGPIGLPNRLKRGQFYELNPAEVANIVKWADMGLPGGRRRR